jgi:hypothetical protein
MTVTVGEASVRVPPLRRLEGHAMLHRTRKFKRTVKTHACALCGHEAFTIATKRALGFTWDGDEVWITERVCLGCALELKRELKPAPLPDDIEVPAF